MPQSTASRRRTLLCTFLILQLFLNVTFTNAAVIRRSVNSTENTTSNNELETPKGTTGVSLSETESSGDGSGTDNPLIDGSSTEADKKVTNLTEFTVDENTVSFNLDGQDEEKEDGNTDVVGSTLNVDEKLTTSAVGKAHSNEEPTTTSKAAGNSIDEFTSVNISVISESNVSNLDGKTASTTDAGVIQSTINLTEGEDVLKRTTDRIPTESTVKVDEISTTRKTQFNEETSTGTTVESTTLSTERNTSDEQKHSELNEVSIGEPSKTSADTNEYITQPTEATTARITTPAPFSFLTTSVDAATFGEDSTKSLTSTVKSDETSTSMFWTRDDKTSTLKLDESTFVLTSTETSDEDPIQTTFHASPLIQDPPSGHEVKNTTSSSAEKRGKFIDDNYSYLNNYSDTSQVMLPNTSEVWALAGMKLGDRVKSSELQNSVETSDEKAVNHSMVTKNLFDWSRVMMSTDEMASETTANLMEAAVNVTTETPATEGGLSTTIVVNLTDLNPATQKLAPLKENEVDVKTTVETTTSLAVDTPDSTPNSPPDSDSTLAQHSDMPSTTRSVLTLLKGRDDEFIEDNKVEGDSVENEPTSVTTTTTTLTPVSVTTERETIKPLANDGETTEEEHTGTISTSTLSLLDFTTPMPFLTSTTATTPTTMAPITTPLNAFNMDDRTNELPNMSATLTPVQTTSPAATLEPAAATSTTTTTTTTPTTTTTTTTPAVTVMAAATIETQTTEAHTPAIISNDMMTQKSNNYNNYEVVNEPTKNSADNSSREAFEVSTRAAAFDWAETTTETPSSSTTEADRFDEDFDITTTVVNFDNNNAYEIATPQTSSTSTFAPSTTVSPLIDTTTTTATTKTTTAISSDTTTTEDLDRIDSIQKISDTGETSIESNVIDPLHVGEASTTSTTITTTESSQDNMRMHPTAGRGWLDSSSTTPSPDDSTTTWQSISTKKEEVYSIVPTPTTIDGGGGFHVPKLVVDDATTTTTISGELAAGGQPMDSSDVQETDVNVIIAISVSVVGIVALILLVAFLYVMRKRQKQMSYGQRCRPVSLDAYSLDNVSVYNSVRRKGAALRASKRSYGNVAFDDPSLRHNVLGTHELAKYVEKKSSIWEEFRDVPQIIARADEVPAGCEDKNRYANVIPLPETRVILQQQNGDEKSEYINANYVRGPKDTTNYYIACQAPLETTVTDFWRMIWEQNSRVIIMATDLIENGIDKCAEYLPPSVTLDNHTVFGDFQVTLKNREVKEKYAISTLLLRNTATEESREITHYWYQWPEAGVPTDEAAIIAMLLEARSSLKLSTIESSEVKTDPIITEEKAQKEINGNVTSEKPKPPPKDQGPLTIHCSPGTGRTGTILACDIAMRCLEEPKRCVDIPQIVYSVRRGRASAVQTKEQYEFIYKVTHMYATKISNLNNDN